MSTLHRAAGASRTLAVSMAVISLCRFARSAVLARMLLPSDFGIGATFTLALTFLELVTELSPSKQLVQAKDGDLPEWQATAHAVLAIRGMALAVVLFLAGDLFAEWLRAPQAALAFRCMAIVPILRNLEHTDITRFQRNLQMRSLAIVNAVPEIASLMTAPLFAWLLGNYWAFLAVTIVASAARTAMTHWFAVRPFRFRYDRAIVRRFTSFGWPLIFNSILLYLIMNGERFLVARNFDLATLGAYSVALTLAFTPQTLLANLHSSVSLPIFSKNQENESTFQRAFTSSAQIMCLSAGLMAIAFVVAGSWLVALMYGPRYLIAQQAIPWIGLMCAVRIARTTPQMAAMGLGDTRIALVSNLARGASFVAAWMVIRVGWGLAWVPVCGFVGEIAAYLISLTLLKKRLHVRVGYHLQCFASVAAIVAGVAALAHVTAQTKYFPAPAALAFGLVILTGFALAAWKDLRRTVHAVFIARLPVGG